MNIPPQDPYDQKSLLSLLQIILRYLLFVFRLLAALWQVLIFTPIKDVLSIQVGHQPVTSSDAMKFHPRICCLPPCPQGTPRGTRYVKDKGRGVRFVSREQQVKHSVPPGRVLHSCLDQKSIQARESRCFTHLYSEGNIQKMCQDL